MPAQEVARELRIAREHVVAGVRGEIAKRLQRASEGEAVFKEGTVYPVLRALSAEGFLRSRIAPSDAGPPRRYYRITREGRALLGQWSGIWNQTRDFVDRFLRGNHP